LQARDLGGLAQFFLSREIKKERRNTNNYSKFDMGLKIAWFKSGKEKKNSKVLTRN